MSQNLCLHIVLIVTVLASSGVTRSNGKFVRNTGLSSSPSDPCSTSPCGPNTSCQWIRRTNGFATAECRCLDGFIPDGHTINGCKPQCTRDNDCPDESSCQATKCVKVCQSGACGLNANCKYGNHRAICTCPRGYQGNPEIRCTKNSPPTTRPPIRDPPIDLCQPNPCGLNAECRTRGDRPDRAVCACIDNYFGDPLSLKGCQPECVVNSDCPSRMACKNNKCVNPCINACGEGAICDVVQGRAKCSCPQFYRGNPHNRCYPECTAHNGCPSHQACYQLQCVDPCAIEGVCGEGAECKVENHKPICSCPKGYTGHPFESCTVEDLCRPNPCGLRADCTPGFDHDNNDRPVCTCPRGFIGNALISCQRGECQQHDDCRDSQGCYNYTCQNPCNNDLGTVCGDNAECSVKNHQPVCSCSPGYSGNPLQSCYPHTKITAGCSRCRFDLS